MASLALGIGLNTALFSVVNGVLLRTSRLSRPDQLVEIYTGLSKDYPQLTTWYPDFLDMRAGADALAAVAANAYVRGILSGASRSTLVTGEVVTANYFDVLGVRPVQGRAFRPEEDSAPGTAAVVVVSHGLWQDRLGGRANVLGETVRISGHPYTVIGVAPADFTGTHPGHSDGVLGSGHDGGAVRVRRHPVEQRCRPWHDAARSARHAVAVRQGPAG